MRQGFPNALEDIRKHPEIQRKVANLEPFTRAEIGRFRHEMKPAGRTPGTHYQAFPASRQEEATTWVEDIVIDPRGAAKEQQAYWQVAGLLEGQGIGLGNDDLEAIRRHPELQTIIDKSKVTEKVLAEIRNDVLLGKAKRVNNLLKARGITILDDRNVLGSKVFQERLGVRTADIAEAILKNLP